MRVPERYQNKSLTDIRIENALDTLTEKPRNRISLRTFENKFLPILAIRPDEGDKVKEILAVMESNTGDGARHNIGDIVHNLIDEWTKEGCDVRLYTDCYNGRNEIVYVIPPLLDTESEFTDRAADIPRLVEMAENQTRAHPQMGRQFIEQHIVTLIKPATVNTEWVKLWNIIYKYHGMPLLKLNGEGDDIVDKEIPKDNPNVIDEFDEFE